VGEASEVIDLGEFVARTRWTYAAAHQRPRRRAGRTEKCPRGREVVVDAAVTNPEAVPYLMSCQVPELRTDRHVVDPNPVRIGRTAGSCGTYTAIKDDTKLVGGVRGRLCKQPGGPQQYGSRGTSSTSLASEHLPRLRSLFEGLHTGSIPVVSTGIRQEVLNLSVSCEQTTRICSVRAPEPTGGRTYSQAGNCQAGRLESPMN